MAAKRGRKLAIFCALVVVGLVVSGIALSDSIVEQYYLYLLRSDDVEKHEEAYTRLVEMGSTRAIGPIIRRRMRVKSTTYEGLVDIAVHRPEEFAVAVQGLVRGSRDRAVRCFAAYILSEISWASAGAVEALESLAASGDSDPLLERFAAIGLREVRRRRDPEKSARPRLGVVLEEKQEGVVVRKVAFGSPASRIGIREDDAIQMLNDVEVGNLGDMMQAMKDRADGEILPVRVLRDGKEHASHIVLDSQASWKDVLPLIWKGIKTETL